MRRYGVSVPVGMTTALVTFIATIVFFGITGPLAILLGAGRSLGPRATSSASRSTISFSAASACSWTLGVLLLVW